MAAFVQFMALGQREVNCSFKKETGLNRSQVEILCFAQSVISFNPYQAQKRFISMNLQQVREGIRKLCLLNAIEIISSGGRYRPAVYMITDTGKRLLDRYTELWEKQLD